MIISRIPSFAQTETLRNFFEQKINWDSLGIKDTQEIKIFYQQLDYTPAWTNPPNNKNLQILSACIRSAGDQALDPGDYPLDVLGSYIPAIGQPFTWNDLFLADLKISNIAIRYYRHLAHGNTTPSFSFSGLKYRPDCIPLASQLATFIKNDKLEEFDETIEPGMKEITALRSEMNLLRQRLLLMDSIGNEEKVSSTHISLTNKPLIKKLFYLGVIDSIDKKYSAVEIKSGVRKVQKLFGLLDDGVIRSSTISELNVPLHSRIKQLSLAINYYRWLYCISTKEHVVVVNIPSTTLKVYDNGKTLMEMRMIVGKPATPTPTLTSRINEVIVYPYWNVPKSIAIKEMLPSIRRNPGYFDANNYQLLDKQGKLVDPYSVNWSSLGPGNFPYVIRQSTGCDNALGLLKLNFYSPFSVYLHDTPSKSLFMLNKRYFSHGCMRMERPLELGHLVLRKNEIAIDTLTEKGCLRNQSPISVPARLKLPVIVWYNPAGINAKGEAVLYPDPYDRFKEW